MNYKIMIVEDDKDIAELLFNHLLKFGFEPYCCQKFDNIIEEFKEFNPHLLLLDITLPSFDGFYWCGKIRKISSCPIIFVSARNADSDQVFAIMNGGDDYITKPFSYDIIIAKINAQLRRTYGEYSIQNKDEKEYGDCIYSQSKLLLRKDEKVVELSKNEAAVIRCLFSKAPMVVTREELLNTIWDDDSFVEENTLNVTISRIRKRLEQIGSELQIRPVRGVGYRIGVSQNEE